MADQCNSSATKVYIFTSVLRNGTYKAFCHFCFEQENKINKSNIVPPEIQKSFLKEAEYKCQCKKDMCHC